MMKKYVVLCCMTALLMPAIAQRPAVDRYNIIPYPQQLQPAAGSFRITAATALIIEGKAKQFQGERALLQKMLCRYLGIKELPSGSGKGRHAIVLQYDSTVKGRDAYKLVIDTQRVRLIARGSSGLFYGIQTLRQLLAADIETGKGHSLELPAVVIEDSAAFQWRGMMLDVSRHFFSLGFLKKQVDLMALYKLNKLHLHLTDDQGWRIEIKKHPRLTAEGGWRTYNNQDSACLTMAEKTGNPDMKPEQKHLVTKNGKVLYGGYYTQAQMKEFIRYAASRHIEVIPEIDMPGHMMAAVKVYPQLTCDHQVGDVRGFSNPLCPCDDKVLQFAREVYGELAALFPSKYIHIGGDEVNKKLWEQSPVVHDFMKKKGFTHVEQVQSYFNDNMLTFFRSKGKVLIGWDEIIEGHIDPSAVMMFWRAWAPGAPLVAARNGNSMVMSPTEPMYFDAIPTARSLFSTYHYDPLQPGYSLTAAQQQQVLGVQANLWTEMVPSEKRAEYMTMPRMTALAEVAWTRQPLYSSYLKRLAGHYDRLDRLQVHYRMPDMNWLADEYALTPNTSFFTTSPDPKLDIRYTTDGSLPQLHSKKLDRPVGIGHPLQMKLALFAATGRRGDVYTLDFKQQSFQPALTKTVPQPGLKAHLYKKSFDSTTQIRGTPDSVFTISSLTVPATVHSPVFALQFNGYIEVPEKGVYTFYLTSDDGGVLRIGGRTVIDNDGPHPARQRGAQVALEKGLHHFAFDFTEAGSGYVLDLRYSFNNSDPAPVPASWWKTE